MQKVQSSVNNVYKAGELFWILFYIFFLCSIKKGMKLLFK